MNPCLDLLPLLEARRFEREGCPIYYGVAGPAQGPVIALLHGATADHRMWNEQVPTLLAAGWRVLAWDARGHGRSQPIGSTFTLEGAADDLLALLDHEGISRLVIAGQSMGGMIAQHLYYKQPQRLRALIMVDTVCLAFAASRFEYAVLKSTLPLFRIWPYENFKRTTAGVVGRQQHTRDYMLDAINQLRREDFLAIWEGVTLAVDDKGRPGQHLDLPLLLIVGEHDVNGTIRRDARRWADYEPQARLEMIPGAAHNANQDNPAAVNAAMLTFLSTLA